MRLAVGVEMALLVVAVLLGWILRTRPLDQIRPTASATLVGVAATLPLVAMAWWVATTKWAPVAQLRREVERTVVPLFAQCTLLDLAIISLLAGLGEEALFRGVLQAALGGWITPVGGLLVASVVFGLAHLVTPTYALIAGLIGLYLGLIYLVTDNLFPPVLVHALFDFVALVYVARMQPPRPGAEG